MIKTISTGIVYENPKPYLRTRHAMHPSLVDLGGGELLCAYDIGDAPEGLDYQTYRSRSRDGGATWTFEGPLVTAPPARRCTWTCRIANLSTGLVAFGTFMYRDHPDEGLINRATNGFVDMDLFLLRSSDRGGTWGAPEILAPPLAGTGMEICHPVLELADGTWLAPTAVQTTWDGARPHGLKSIVLISRDKGRTWPDYGVTFDGGAQNVIHWEQSVVPLSANRLLAVAWAHDLTKGRNLPNPFALSADGGRTFQPGGAIGIQGQTCKGLRLADGRILLVYRRSDKPGLWAHLFDFADGMWRPLEDALLWRGGLASSGMTGAAGSMDELSALKFGFPQMRQLANGEVFLVFWCFEEWCTKIRWFRLSLGD